MKWYLVYSLVILMFGIGNAQDSLSVDSTEVVVDATKLQIDRIVGFMEAKNNLDEAYDTQKRQLNTEYLKYLNDLRDALGIEEKYKYTYVVEGKIHFCIEPPSGMR